MLVLVGLKFRPLDLVSCTTQFWMDTVKYEIKNVNKLTPVYSVKHAAKQYSCKQMQACFLCIHQSVVLQRNSLLQGGDEMSPNSSHFPCSVQNSEMPEGQRCWSVAVGSSFLCTLVFGTKVGSPVEKPQDFLLQGALAQLGFKDMIRPLDSVWVGCTISEHCDTYVWVPRSLLACCLGGCQRGRMCWRTPWLCSCAAELQPRCSAMRISAPRSHLHVQQVACFCFTKPQPDLGVRKTIRLCSMKQHKTSTDIAVTKCLLALCSSSPYCPCWHIARQAWSWSPTRLSCAADLAFVWDTWVLVLCNWFLWHTPTTPGDNSSQIHISFS